MLFRDVQTLVLDAGLSLLPEKMDSKEARAMLMAIGLQESGFRHRHQINGPAHGYYQFEPIGVQGVMEHPASKGYIRGVLAELDYPLELKAAYIAIEHNDALACVFARLLLWTLPDKLPHRDNPSVAWDQYLSTWRPGKPHPGQWDARFDRAWEFVSPSNKTQFAEADMDY